MGVDIHMALVRNDGKILIKDVYDGRNSEWFSNLQRNGLNDEYYSLPDKPGIPEFAPAFIKEDYEGAPQNGYYGFAYMSFQDYAKWYEEYKPQFDAGWVSTYDKWRMEKKGYIPEDVLHYFPEDANPVDLHFIEFTNPYDPNTCVINAVYKYFLENEEDYPCQAYLIYYFDC